MPMANTCLNLSMCLSMSDLTINQRILLKWLLNGDEIPMSLLAAETFADEITVLLNEDYDSQSLAWIILGKAFEITQLANVEEDEIPALIEDLGRVIGRQWDPTAVELLLEELNDEE